MSRAARTGAWILALAFTGGLGMGVGMMIAEPGSISSTSYAAESRAAEAARERLAVGDFKTAFQEVAKVMRPSVVTIESTAKVRPVARQFNRGQRPQLPPGFEDFLGQDFGKFFNAPNGGQPGQGLEQHGSGTGVIVTADGYVLTNNHVVRDADEVKVTLSDGRSYPAKVVGADDKTDVAVVKIDAHDLTPAELGNSDEIEVGQWAVAMGAPFGLSETVTAGIVSAKGRANVGIADYEDFIQTDAAINPGNSGGPLVNMRGQVIGINTAIASRSGGNMGVGFAIPINMARTVMNALMKDGKIERGWLGAAIQDLNENLAGSFGYKSHEGVLIGDVTAGSPAEKAGLKAGDIVVSLNGRPMAHSHNLRNAVAATMPNTAVKLEVFRDGKTMTVDVTVGRLDPKTAQRGGPNSNSEDSSEPAATTSTELGLSVETLTEETAQKLGFDAEQQGVVVTDVENGSLAARASVRPQDVITRIGDTPVTSVEDFTAALKNHDLKEGVRMQVKREGFQRFVFLKSGS